MQRMSSDEEMSKKESSRLNAGKRPASIVKRRSISERDFFQGEIHSPEE
jgi:hypothetical protein